MKPHFIPLILSFGFVAFLGYIAKGSFDATKRERAALATKASQVDILRRNLEGLNRDYDRRRAESSPQEAFLLLWSEDHRKNGALAGDIIRLIAEQQSLTVTELKRDDAGRKTKAGGYEFVCDRYSIKVLGPFPNILRFIGQTENRLSSASLLSLTMGRNLNDVALHLQIAIPHFEQPPSQP